MFTNVGKKQMMAAMDTFGASPLPSSSTRIGAVATTGIEWTNTAIGKKACSRLLRCTNTVAMAIAAVFPSRNPHRASNAVGPRFAISMPNF
jgi:uncharacterized membrane protein